MKKTSKIQKSRLVSECIFCGCSGKLSDEHIWPEWLSHALQLPIRKHDQRSLVIKSIAPKEVLFINKFKEFQKPLHRKVLKVVCATCNNGWMSQIEEKAKPFIKTLALGKDVELNTEDQKLICLWATLKTIIAEFSQPETCKVSFKDREYIFKNRQVPENWMIWIGWYGGDIIKDTAYSHRSIDAIDKEKTPRTYEGIQFTTFIIGKLLIHTCSWSIDVFNKIVAEYSPPGLFPIMPTFEYPYRHIGIPPVLDDDFEFITNGLYNWLMKTYLSNS